LDGCERFDDNSGVGAMLERMLERLKKLLQGKKPKTVKPRTTSKRKAVSVTIGLDFGTCATKCVINLEAFDRNRDKFLTLAFPSKASRDGILCMPTAIGVHNGNLVFGEDGDSLAEEHVIRSFKMAIPCIGEAWGTYHSPFMSASKPGHFDIEGRCLSATDLAALYLAVILRQIRHQVRQYLGEASDISVFLNLAAPLNELVPTTARPTHNETPGITDDTVRDTAVSREYVALGQQSLFLSKSKSSQNPWPLRLAMAALERAKAQPILSLEESPAYVVPETLAAIAGFVNRPGTQSGRFMTLDVGAGSTDASVFWLEKHDGIIKPWYYASRSLHLGMDAIDSALAAVTQMSAGRSVRARREALQRSEGGLANYRCQCKDALVAIDRHRRTTFGHGYMKEKTPSKWGDVVLLLIGGGCQADIVQELSHNVLWQNTIGSPSVEVLGLDVTKQVLGPDGREYPLDKVAGLEEQAYLLIIAEGLANKIVNIPPFGVTTKGLVKPRQRRPIPPELWFANGRDDTWG